MKKRIFGARILHKYAKIKGCEVPCLYMKIDLPREGVKIPS